MPARDSIHDAVKEAVIKDGWEVTDDPYVISYGDRFLFVDLAASGFIGVRQGNKQIAIEIKQFRGQSQVVDLEQVIGQYSLYRILLTRLTQSVISIWQFLRRLMAIYLMSQSVN